MGASGLPQYTGSHPGLASQAGSGWVNRGVPRAYGGAERDLRGAGGRHGPGGLDHLSGGMTIVLRAFKLIGIN